MAVLQTVEDLFSSFLVPPARDPVVVDCVDPPLPVATTAMKVADLLTAMRTTGNALAPYLYNIAAIVVAGDGSEGGIPVIPGQPSDAIWGVYLPAGPAYTVNVGTDTPAWWIRVG